MDVCPLFFGVVVLRKVFRCRDGLIQGHAVRLRICLAFFNNFHKGRNVLRIPGDSYSRHVRVGGYIEFCRILIEFSDLDPFVPGQNFNRRIGSGCCFFCLEQDGDFINLLSMNQFILHISRIGSGKGSGNIAITYDACVFAIVGHSDWNCATENFALIDFKFIELQPLGAALCQTHAHIFGRLPVAITAVGIAVRCQIRLGKGTDFGPVKVVCGNFYNGSLCTVAIAKHQLDCIDIDQIGIFQCNRLALILRTVGPDLGAIIAVCQVAQRIVSRLIQFHTAGGASKFCNGFQRPRQRIYAKCNRLARVVLYADKGRLWLSFAGISRPGLSVHRVFHGQAFRLWRGKPGQCANLVKDNANILIALKGNIL